MENLEGIQDPNAQEQETELQQEQETEVTEPQASEGESGEETPGSEYTPDFKFKYKDEEFEFDERLRGIVKNKDDEQFIRDLVTAQKAHSDYKEIGGIREIQSQFEKYQGIEKEHSTLNQEIDQLSGMLALNNTAGFEAFRNHLGIDKQQILKWAAEEAQGMQDPQVAAQIAAQRNMQQENFNLSYQNQMMQNNIESENVQQRTAELDTLLGSNDVSQAYDNLVGKPGSFKQAVIEHGFNVYNATIDPQTGVGKTLSVAEAVEAVAGKFQGLIANQNSGTNNQVAQNPVQTKSDPQQTVVIKQESKQTIPNFGGGSGSPAKKKITSLADMKKLADSMD